MIIILWRPLPLTVPFLQQSGLVFGVHCLRATRGLWLQKMAELVLRLCLAAPVDLFLLMGHAVLRAFKCLDFRGSLPLCRMSVFKMANCMVAGKIVSLATPVLASIYRGIHLITIAYYPNNSSCCFLVHYLLGWIGAYLRTYTSVKRPPLVPHMVRYSGID
ncbi:hypothetical protein LIER_26846 [Lithospermum erythrorhizon]|uniref:Uncharacterized protein n=1 Tax=Lithospermum erythrorhizon TaxID=34254 RepID=A0AAV3RBD8_LITER